MTTIQPLTPALLCRRCDPDRFNFETTAELEDLAEIIGQTKAIEAMRFGIGIQREGYNLYVLGPHGTGKHSAIRQFLEQKAVTEPRPSDWCYVNNFDQCYRPRRLRLPAGQGIVLREDMAQLVEELRTILPAAFESDDYRARKQAIVDEFKERQEKAFDNLRQQARERGIALLHTPGGVAFAPLHDGEVIAPEQFHKLPQEEQARIETEAIALQEQLQAAVQQVPRWEKELRDRLRNLNQEITEFVLRPPLTELRQKYQQLPEVVEYLNAVQQDIIENVDDFLHPSEETAVAPVPGGPILHNLPGSPAFRRYQVNVLVDHSVAQGAPVVYEDHPTYQNLAGQVEHMMAQMGALITDFNLIKPGALHRANGGYLLLDAHKVLSQPFAWEQLKRALRSRQIRIESLGQLFGLVSTISLEPEPIPLDVKIVLLGERLLYYLLHQFDPDFAELFKVQVDFEEQMSRNPAHDLLYARLISTLARKEGLRHFDRSAVARVIEYSARLVGDAEKLSTRMQSIADLLREADYWAGQAGNTVVSEDDLQRAIDAQIARADRLRGRLQEEIQRDILLIDTQGEKVGQVNGLSVITLGNFSFGHPSRITARVRLGKGEVIDIEREVELGGPLHSKGVLILAGYLGGRYAPHRPLSLSASLVFEQSYSGIEGDSASSAELYALLSALAEAPIKQALAVTGSVNQHGQIQAIGGVNEKIEGFFDVCRARGLTGEQGVLIPAANLKHLMLRQDVVEAAAAGRFSIYPVKTIDEGIELLTGIAAGEREESGRFPEDSINGRVEARLVAFADQVRAFNAPPATAKEVQA